MASWRESISPHSGGTVPDLHRVPSPRSVCGASLPFGDVHARATAGARPLGLAARRRLGGGDLRVLVGAEPSTELGTWDTILRKLAHVAEYAILGVLLARATPPPLVAVALAGLYAVTDELHQTFVEGRHGSPLDVGIDTLGAPSACSPGAASQAAGETPAA